FYSERTRQDEPEVRGALDAIFILSSLGVVLVAALGLWLGLDFSLTLALAALAPAMGICNGLFDYHTALARARFDERGYSLMVILKNALSLTLMVGGAWWFGSPEAVAAGFVLSIALTMLLARRRLVDPGVRLGMPDFGKARTFFVYGFPVIAASLLYFLIPLWNRTAIAGDLGFAASGQFSLAYDISIRVVQTIGSALDLILFQLALKAQEESGEAAGRERLRASMGVVIAAMAAVGGGYWLVLPAFEATLAPAAFRGSYQALAAMLLPGLVCYGLAQAAVTPVFQLRGKTWPVIVAAGLAVATNATLTFPLDAKATALDFARAQSIAYGVGLVALIGLALREARIVPRLRDLAGTLAASTAMVVAVWPLRALEPGLLALMIQAAAGGTAFVAVALAVDLCGLRRALGSRLRPPPGP
ncbi:MAG: polysaccharide biosynthesis C-terminal domain-containing protein, partial [Beijerinckiaceae bacterium]